MLVHRRLSVSLSSSTLRVAAHGWRNKGMNHGLNHQSSCFKCPVPQTIEPQQFDHTAHTVTWLPNFKSTGLPILQYWLADYLYLYCRHLFFKSTGLPKLQCWLADYLCLVVYSRMMPETNKGTNKEELVSVLFAKMSVGVLPS